MEILILLLTFLFFVALVVGVISLIVLIVMAVKKKRKKASGIVTASSFVLALIFLVALVAVTINVVNDYPTSTPVSSSTSSSSKTSSSSADADSDEESVAESETEEMDLSEYKEADLRKIHNNEYEKQIKLKVSDAEVISITPNDDGVGNMVVAHVDNIPVILDDMIGYDLTLNDYYTFYGPPNMEDGMFLIEYEESDYQPSKEDTKVEEVDEDLTEETPLTPVEEIENIITGVVGEDSVSEMNVEEANGSYEVDLTYAASENFTANMTANGIKRDMVDVALKLQESEHNVSYLLMAATLPLTDSSGNESDGKVITVSFYGETIDQLNPENEIFLYDNLESAADGYSAHPDFR